MACEWQGLTSASGATVKREGCAYSLSIDLAPIPKTEHLAIRNGVKGLGYLLGNNNTFKND